MKLSELVKLSGLAEAYKKVSEPTIIGNVKGGVLYLHSFGFDTNGNWSYMVTKGGNKKQKIQHDGGWKGSKVTKDTDLHGLKHTPIAKEIIAYYDEHLNK